MAFRVNRKKRTINQKYRLWRNLFVSMKVMEFASPLVPFATLVGINWEEWFGKSQSEGWSIGLGFGMLAVATIMAILEIVKRDELMKTKLSFAFYAAVVFVMIGFSFKLLASIMSEMGDFFLYVSCGIAGGGVMDQMNAMMIKPRADFYKDLIEKNGLSRAAARRNDDVEQAAKEGEAARKAREDRNYL